MIDSLELYTLIFKFEDKEISLNIDNEEIYVLDEVDLTFDELDYISNISFEYAYLILRKSKRINLNKILNRGYLPYLDYHFGNKTLN